MQDLSVGGRVGVKVISRLGNSLETSFAVFFLLLALNLIDKLELGQFHHVYIGARPDLVEQRVLLLHQS